jgi:short-subunit dehydrogenase
MALAGFGTLFAPLFVDGRVGTRRPEENRAMGTRLKCLSEQVMVITGASSGIGMATACAAARRGARLVLAARNEEALADVASQINDSGGSATYVAADVAERDALAHVADVAIERHGGFDTWVNNAAVGLYGRLDEADEADHRRLFETNFWGAVHGSLIAAEHLRQRGGAIINVGSIASDNAIPLLGMYSATKHALRGFTDALRMELELDEAPISITLIKPTSINTPFPEHARKYTDRQPQVPPPVYPPEEVAEAILYAATHSKRDIYVGSMSRIMSSLGSRAPRTMDWISENFMAPREFRDEPAHHTQGALYEAGRDGRLYGDYPGFVRPLSVYTRAVTHPVVAGVSLSMALAVGAAAAAWLLRDQISDRFSHRSPARRPSRPWRKYAPK